MPKRVRKSLFYIHGTAPPVERKSSYKCLWEGCNAKYEIVTEFYHHVGTHGHDRAYVCKWERCCKQFKTITDIKRHLYTHTGERRFGCDVCLKRFYKKEHLKSHLLVHDRIFNELPYVCDAEDCYERFSTVKALEAHERLHTFGSWHQCTFMGCTMGYGQKKRLTAHINSQHKTNRKRVEDSNGSQGIILKHKKKLNRTGQLSPNKESDEKVESCRTKGNTRLSLRIRPVYKFSCDIDGCTLSFELAAALKRHISQDHPTHLNVKDHRKESSKADTESMFEFVDTNSEVTSSDAVSPNEEEYSSDVLRKSLESEVKRISQIKEEGVKARQRNGERKRRKISNRIKNENADDNHQSESCPIVYNMEDVEESCANVGESLPEVKVEEDTLYGFARGLKPEKIIGFCCRDPLAFAIKWEGRHETDQVLAEEANYRCPQLVIQFYQQRVSVGAPMNIPGYRVECPKPSPIQGL